MKRMYVLGKLELLRDQGLVRPHSILAVGGCLPFLGSVISHHFGELCALSNVFHFYSACREPKGAFSHARSTALEPGPAIRRRCLSQLEIPFGQIRLFRGQGWLHCHCLGKILGVLHILTGHITHP